VLEELLPMCLKEAGVYGFARAGDGKSFAVVAVVKDSRL